MTDLKRALVLLPVLALYGTSALANWITDSTIDTALALIDWADR